MHLTPNAYAGQCGVGQWTLSRFLNGRTKNITPAMEPALRYARIDWNTGITNPATAADNARLRNALNKVWDGSEETAELLAGMIEALGPVVARCVKHR